MTVDEAISRVLEMLRIYDVEDIGSVKTLAENGDCLDPVVRRLNEITARINAALEEGRFELYRMQIQPLQRNEPGQHYELLLRMRDESGRMVSPDNFIAAAERYGLTPAIDRWVIENALRWLVSEADEREKLAMCSINLSGQSLGDDKFLPFVIEQFAKSGGLVLLTGDSKVEIKGAKKLDVKPRMPDQDAIDKIMESKKYEQLGPYTTVGKYLAGAEPLAKAIKAELDKVKIMPVIFSDIPTIVATRQAWRG